MHLSREDSEASCLDVSSSVVSHFRTTARVIIELCSRRIRQMAHPEVSIIELGELVDVSVSYFLTFASGFAIGHGSAISAL